MQNYTKLKENEFLIKNYSKTFKFNQKQLQQTSKEIGTKDGFCWFSFWI